MRWSLSEFLNLAELRSQTWCFVSMDAASGFSMPHSDAIYFYVALDGGAKVSGLTGGAFALRPGEVAIVLSGEAHAVRSQSNGAALSLPFLATGEYADTPPHFMLGDGFAATRVLASRLKVRWPGGQHPRTLPAVLKLRSDEGVVNFDCLLDKAAGGGAMAVLTRAANLMFVSAFRDHPECRAAFQDFNLHDPISRAQQYIETHPFDDWSVETLARKVGMGRSNFAARFTSEIGLSPMTFLADQRMKHAMLFLEKTDMKLAEICEKIGYKSEAAFIRRFTARFGMTPGELRKRSRAAAAALAEWSHQR